MPRALKAVIDDHDRKDDTCRIIVTLPRHHRPVCPSFLLYRKELWQTLAAALPRRTIGVLGNNCHGIAKANRWWFVQFSKKHSDDTAPTRKYCEAMKENIDEHQSLLRHVTTILTDQRTLSRLTFPGKLDKTLFGVKRQSSLHHVPFATRSRESHREFRWRGQS